MINEISKIGHQWVGLDASDFLRKCLHPDGADLGSIRLCRGVPRSHKNPTSGSRRIHSTLQAFYVSGPIGLDWLPSLLGAEAGC